MATVQLTSAVIAAAAALPEEQVLLRSDLDRLLGAAAVARVAEEVARLARRMGTDDMEDELLKARTEFNLASDRLLDCERSLNVVEMQARRRRTHMEEDGYPPADSMWDVTFCPDVDDEEQMQEISNLLDERNAMRNAGETLRQLSVGLRDARDVMAARRRVQDTSAKVEVLKAKLLRIQESLVGMQKRHGALEAACKIARRHARLAAADASRPRSVTGLAVRMIIAAFSSERGSMVIRHWRLLSHWAQLLNNLGSIFVPCSAPELLSSGGGQPLLLPSDDANILVERAVADMYDAAAGLLPSPPSADASLEERAAAFGVHTVPGTTLWRGIQVATGAEVDLSRLNASPNRPVSEWGDVRSDVGRVAVALGAISATTRLYRTHHLSLRGSRYDDVPDWSSLIMSTRPLLSLLAFADSTTLDTIELKHDSRRAWLSSLLRHRYDADRLVAVGVEALESLIDLQTRRNRAVLEVRRCSEWPLNDAPSFSSEALPGLVAGFGRRTGPVAPGAPPAPPPVLRLDESEEEWRRVLPWETLTGVVTRGHRADVCEDGNVAACLRLGALGPPARDHAIVRALIRSEAEVTEMAVADPTSPWPSLGLLDPPKWERLSSVYSVSRTSERVLVPKPRAMELLARFFRAITGRGVSYATSPSPSSPTANDDESSSPLSPNPRKPSSFLLHTATSNAGLVALGRRNYLRSYGALLSNSLVYYHHSAHAETFESPAPVDSEAEARNVLARRSPAHLIHFQPEAWNKYNADVTQHCNVAYRAWVILLRRAELNDKLPGRLAWLRERCDATGVEVDAQQAPGEDRVIRVFGTRDQSTEPPEGIENPACYGIHRAPAIKDNANMSFIDTDSTEYPLFLRVVPPEQRHERSLHTMLQLWQYLHSLEETDEDAEGGREDRAWPSAGMYKPRPRGHLPQRTTHHGELLPPVLRARWWEEGHMEALRSVNGRGLEMPMDYELSSPSPVRWVRPGVTLRGTMDPRARVLQVHSAGHPHVNGTYVEDVASRAVAGQEVAFVRQLGSVRWSVYNSRRNGWVITRRLRDNGFVRRTDDWTVYEKRFARGPGQGLPPLDDPFEPASVRVDEVFGEVWARASMPIVTLIHDGDQSANDEAMSSGETDATDIDIDVGGGATGGDDVDDAGAGGGGGGATAVRSSGRNRGAAMSPVEDDDDADEEMGPPEPDRLSWTDVDPDRDDDSVVRRALVEGLVALRRETELEAVQLVRMFDIIEVRRQLVEIQNEYEYGDMTGPGIHQLSTPPRQVTSTARELDDVHVDVNGHLDHTAAMDSSAPGAGPSTSRRRGAADAGLDDTDDSLDDIAGRRPAPPLPASLTEEEIQQLVSMFPHVKEDDIRDKAVIATDLSDAADLILTSYPPKD